MPASATDLIKQAREFAGNINDLLNRTVTTGVSLSVVMEEGLGTCWVAHGITKNSLRPGVIPLTPRRKAAPRAFLGVNHILVLDPERTHLAASKSGYSLYADAEAREMLFHYDYVREPDNDYPAAHFQVDGHSEPFDELCRKSDQTKPLKDFHFPVGGRRFRPTLEDVIEFLIVEGLVEAHDGWKGVLEGHRRDWERRQLRAAVRRDPEAARAELAQIPED